MSEKGPIYGVELIDALPVGSAGMKQAMPSRMDLNRVLKVNERTVAGYEVLLASWRELLTASKAAVNVLEAIAPMVQPPATMNHIMAWFFEELRTIKATLAKAETTP